MNIEMALKSRSCILDLDLVKNTHQKAVNLMFYLILHVAKEPWLFLEVQFY